MARSIHSTRRKLHRELQTDYADPKKKRGAVRQIAQALRLKRRIKKQVTNERHQRPTNEHILRSDAFGIKIEAQHPNLHYPATQEDIRGVLDRLPLGTLTGISSIQLSSGTEHMRKDLKRYRGNIPADLVQDPWLQRWSTEWLPGIFLPEVLGRYHHSCIWLFGYVYKSNVPNRRLHEFILKLKMLGTLVHEVAHHKDDVTRVARGRWLALGGEKTENYADDIEWTWIKEAVIPYVTPDFAR